MKAPKERVIVFDLEAKIETIQMGKFSRVDGARSYIMSIQWSFLDSPKVYSKGIHETKSFKKSFNDDSDLCKFILDLLSDPTIVGWITQNGTNFDIPLINTRCMINKLPVLPHVDHADTLKMARAGKGKLLLASFSLDHMTKVFGLSAKDKVDDRTWTLARAGHVPSIKRIVKYGEQDIPCTKELYNVLSKTHAKGLVAKFDGIHCVRCGKTEFKNDGTRLLSSGKREQQMRCKSCGKWHGVKV